MKYNPHDYQRFATQMILDHPYCGLLLDMGLGKTVSTLTAINDLLYNRFEVNRVLVIAPKRVADMTWPQEVEKWDHLKHLRVSRILGAPAQRRAAMRVEADLYLINRENVVWLVEEIGQAPWPFDMVVLDELSSFKSNRAARFRALRRVRGKIDRVVGLTGTPAPNGLIDLWPQIFLLDGGKRLGKTVTGYRERYFTPDKRNATTVFSWKPKEGAESAIYHKIGDICISMQAEDHLTLPERTDIVVPVNLDPANRAAYDKLERESILALGGGTVAAPQAATLLGKLLQFTGGAVYADDGTPLHFHECKIRALEELIEQAQGRPLLVYYVYKHERARLLEALPLARDLDPEKWNQREQAIALAHPASCGHGLNLQSGGSILVWYGLPWSLELYEQANARLHRQGQTESVRVYHLVATGTVDEQVMAGLSRKAIGQDALLKALKAKIGGAE